MTHSLFVGIFLSCALLLFIVYLRHRNLYWKQRHVQYVRPQLFVGNLKDLFTMKISFGDLFQRLYEDAAVRDAPFGGIFLLQQPALILRDPDLIKLVLIKQFHKFRNRFEAADEKYDVMGALTLPLSKYHIWRDCRKKMSEAFTSGKMKEQMFPIMLGIAKELELFLQRQFQEHSKNSAIVEVKEMCSLFTTDLTSQLHYGKDIRGLKQGTSSLRQQTLALFDVDLKRIFNFFVIFFMPQWTSWLRAKVFSQTYMEFMRQFTKKLCQNRKPNSIARLKGDLIDILLKFQKDYKDKPWHYTQHSDFISSQVGIFLLAGFETSSSVIGFILYELAKRRQIQIRLKMELKQNFKDQHLITYEELQALPYLQQVVYEGLRMYPAAAFINRECTLEKAENCAEVFHLTPEIFITNGMPVYISILGLHRDSKYWPQPNEFIPERFAPSNLKGIHPMTYIPFGAGPHGCIGSRLGLLQVKLGLAYILKSYTVETCAKTIKEIKFDPKSFMLQAKGGIYLKFSKDD